MKFKHTFKHVDVSEPLKAFVEERLGEMNRFLLKEGQFQIFYSKGKRHDCCVELTFSNGNGHFKAAAHSDDSFYAAAEDVIHKLSKQCQKRKERLQTHKDFSQSKGGKLNEMQEGFDGGDPWSKKSG
jgi:putative sigma-54 modulation protein